MHSGWFLKIFLIIAAISLLFDWYVFSGLKTLTADWQYTRMRHVVLFGFLLISIGITVLFLFGFGSFSRAQGMRPFHEWMLSLFLTLFITKLFFVVILSLGDFGRFLFGIFNNITKSSGNASHPFFPGKAQIYQRNSNFNSCNSILGIYICHV